jgi:uncharacterized Tic20 family protein
MSQGDQQSSASAFPPELQAANATKEDRTLAMIGHLLGLVSFIGPLILYLVKKDSASKFVIFHIKQSLFYQLAVMVVMFVLVIGSFIVTAVTAGVGACVCFPIMGLASLGALVYLVVGAIQVNGGKDFEYYLVGPWVRKSV